MAYAGTDQQIRLQQRAEELHTWLYDTPGCCHPGRFCGTDDPQRLGWDVIESALQRDQVFGFRLRPAQERQALAERLAQLGCQLHTWDVFYATVADASATLRSQPAMPLPDGLTECVLDAGEPETRAVAIQTFLAEQGMAPFSSRMLQGQLGPAATPYLLDGAGRVVACAHAYLPHNRFSAHEKTAWVGLVAVSPTQRGRRLGVYINARAIQLAAQLLGATAVYELVAPGNEPSRRMVEACGVRHRPELLCGMATQQENRFTV
ncbi:MAG: GNAT family N-acetyltransferase [Hydrogenophaga sp.]|uniref:GNAT family N-acetyltransferase n=1 Tax=Hydrogenophaga sp. TaxID=1904254 RepID=UPI001DB7792A|nr:GNAT family N-acetyltransferase [Hydrogenophaga sp.]MBX3611578.1 GNAT family N-acetyltransferase [Hydrogenophaga sp.]